MKEQPKKPSNAIRTFCIIRRLDDNRWRNDSYGEWTECIEEATFFYECQALRHVEDLAKNIHERDGKIVRVEVIPVDMVPRW